MLELLKFLSELKNTDVQNIFLYIHKMCKLWEMYININRVIYAAANVCFLCI